MTAIHVRDVPESTISALRERAERHGNSMQQEIRDILGSAAAEPAERQAVDPIRLVTVRTSTTGTFRREDIYGDKGR